MISPFVNSRSIPDSNEELGSARSSNGPTGETIYLGDLARELLAEPFITTVLLSLSTPESGELPCSVFPFGSGELISITPVVDETSS